MNFDFERGVAEVRLIVEEAMEMYAEMVAAGDVEESSDPSESFLCGVVHGVNTMKMIREEYDIKTEAEAVRASNN